MGMKIETTVSVRMCSLPDKMYLLLLVGEHVVFRAETPESFISYASYELHRLRGAPVEIGEEDEGPIRALVAKIPGLESFGGGVAGE